MSNPTNNTDNSNPDFENSKFRVKVASPGRINLIGEHTDYNMGFVMPTAIDKKIYFELTINGDAQVCNIFSETYNSRFSFNLNTIHKSSETWENYILGVVNEIQKKGKKLKGFDATITSELPVGAGISSSAALECGLAAGLNSLFDLELSNREIVSLSQAAENNFVGSQCGIMDQYASVMSKPGHLILLDCLSLEAQYISANFHNCKILLINTKVSHSLAEGEYNNRRKECEAALQVFRSNSITVKTLRDVDLPMLEQYKDQLTLKQYNRVKYVLKENQRVLQAGKLLERGALKEFGALMYLSHLGLKDLYEVSCAELDFLVAYTLEAPYIYGSRMMGGGFGGCTINIIEQDHIPEFEKEVTKAYKEKFGIIPEFICVVPSGGTLVSKSEI